MDHSSEAAQRAISDASLAATSSKGAVKQNRSISATPVRMWSVDEVEEAALVMAPLKYITEHASIPNVTPGSGQERREIAGFRLETIVSSSEL